MTLMPQHVLGLMTHGGAEALNITMWPLPGTSRHFEPGACEPSKKTSTSGRQRDPPSASGEGPTK